MATAAEDHSREVVSSRNGLVIADVEKAPTSASPAKALGENNGGSSKVLNGTSKASSQSGPPILHPTITTWQWLFAASDMQHTPTVLHSGATPEQERYWRWKGAQLIFRIGDYMRLGNHVMTTAAMFFHRFYMRRSLPKEQTRERPHDTFTFQEMAPTCIFLACKVEETHRKLHGVVEATMAVMDRTPQGLEIAEARAYKADVKSKEYRRWKEVVLLYEERLLETLCFDLVIEQPHPIAIKACKRLSTSRDMAQLTVILLNTMLYGAVCTFYDAATLAASAFYKACQLVEIDINTYTALLGSSRTWYDAFDVDAEEVNDAMPDINEQLTFHNENVSAQQPPTSALKSHFSTPNVHQHTSLINKRSNVDMAITTPKDLSDKQSKHLQFVADQDSPSVRKGDLSGGPHPENRHGGAGEGGQGERDEWAIDRERRSDDCIRPISRHGSKGTSLGPPAPLALEDAGLAARSSPNDTHERAAAEKVSREQKETDKDKEEGEAETSEEEGAL